MYPQCLFGLLVVTFNHFFSYYRRLSKENVKFSGRQIGKLGHSNPAILFDHVSLLILIDAYNSVISLIITYLKSCWCIFCHNIYKNFKK